MVANAASQPRPEHRTGGGNIDPAMEHMIYRDLLAFLLIAAAIVLVRMRQEMIEREIDSFAAPSARVIGVLSWILVIFFSCSMASLRHG